MSYCPVHDVFVDKKEPCGPTACKDCNSLACILSPCRVSVKKWKCYQKKYENV